MDWNLKAASWDLAGFEQDGVETVDGLGRLNGFRANNKTSGEFSIDLKLGGVGNSLQESITKWEQPGFAKANSSASGSVKRSRVSNNGANSVSCLVDGCNSDLSTCREYHRRHKVCEIHSKTPEVTIRGQKQRFCQQCSRFHSLEEFDEGKRSCRRRLDGHNRRRRKPQPDPMCRRGSFLSNFRGSQFLQFSGSHGCPSSNIVSPELCSFRGRSMLELSEVGAFESLPNLRELAVHNSHIKQLWEYNKRSSGLDSPISGLPLLLLLIPSISTALNLRAECLVKVYLPGSNDALVQDLVNLKQLDLSCSSFTRMPDLSRACNLQTLDLHCCNNLVDVSFIQYLTKLEYINLKGCTSLARLPSLMALKLLLSLDLSDCINLRRLPPSLGCLSSLAALDLSNCKRIQNLPKGILRLKSVQTLSIFGCSMLMEQASGPDGMLIENQVNLRAHSSSHASDEEVSMSYLPVDKYVPTIPLQQPEEERIICKYNSMASKDAAEPSSTTQDLELHKEVLKAYMNMPVEKIRQANAFYYVQRTVDSLIRRSLDFHESASLHDLMYCLEELQENVPETMSCMHDALVSKTSIQVKLAHLRSSFVQSEEHYNGLAARLSVISDEEEDLDAEIDRLLAKRRELLD